MSDDKQRRADNEPPDRPTNNDTSPIESKKTSTDGQSTAKPNARGREHYLLNGQAALDEWLKGLMNDGASVVQGRRGRGK
jgi:hypothetical protein